MGLTRTTVPALGASLLLFMTGCGEETSPSDEPSTDASASDTLTGSEPAETAGATDEPAVLMDFGQEPATRGRYKKAALRAVDDDLVTMVPTVLPDGWTTVGGGYRADPQWWRMEFTAPSGDVVLDQFPGAADTLLADQAGIEASGEVDLSAWGTGAWSLWQHQGATVLTYDLKRSTIILQGADQVSVEDLAKSLLPAEDAVSQDG